MSLDTITCTCGSTSEWVHHTDCDLWMDDDFYHGTAYWDHGIKSLVIAGIHDFRSDEDWAQIIDMDADFEIIDVEAEDDDDPNHTELVCYCFEQPVGNWCPSCGLIRNHRDAPWEAGYNRDKREREGDIRPCECNPQCSMRCKVNRVQRWDSGSDHWVYWDPDAPKVARHDYDDWEGLGAWGYGSTKITAKNTVWVPKCRHYAEDVVFPDGTSVWASSEFRRKDDEPRPDLGVYMTGMWEPTSVAFHLGWTDYGLPKISDNDVAWIIDTALEWARGGWQVEVGCMGGHGRTGSVLALMALSCGIDDPDDAIKWVRDNYCEEAIEGKKQEWYIRKFYAVRNGLPIPPEPVLQTVPHASGSGVKSSGGSPAASSAHKGGGDSK